MASILIIEDEISIAELERDYLELSGFEVEIETSGTSGLERALKEDFNLIILDLMLPGIDGFDICKKIREHKNTPIIMVSAKKDDIDKIRGLGLGADDYMTKPFFCENMIRIFSKKRQQIKFLCCKCLFLTIYPHAARCFVNLNSSNLHDIILLCIAAN